MAMWVGERKGVSGRSTGGGSVTPCRRQGAGRTKLPVWSYRCRCRYLAAHRTARWCTRPAAVLRCLDGSVLDHLSVVHDAHSDAHPPHHRRFPRDEDADSSFRGCGRRGAGPGAHRLDRYLCGLLARRASGRLGEQSARSSPACTDLRQAQLRGCTAEPRQLLLPLRGVARRASPHVGGNG